MSDLAELVEHIDAIVSFPEFSSDIAAGLSLIRPEDPRAELDAFVARVRGRFETSRNFAIVLQFLQDHSRLTDRELVRLFEFIYSKLVNKFKGELGELFAARTVSEFPALLGEGVEVLHGSRLTARQLMRRGGWYDAADALYCRRDGDAYEIVAVAEVKSKWTSVVDMRAQVAKNVLRLRRGFRVAGVEVPAERVRIAANGVIVPASDVSDDHAAAVTALLILPWTDAASGIPVRHPELPNAWLAQLPYSQDEITEGAYRFVAWYFETVGNDEHAFMEAIYHTAFRPTFNPDEVPPPGRRTAWETLVALYNSMGFGFERGMSKVLKYPEFTPDEQHTAWLERHEAAMAEYHAGRLAEALARFPDPAQQTYAAWAPREWILLARLRARAGDAAGARAALASLGGDPHQSASLSTRMEAAAVDALIAIAAGEGAEEGLRRAVMMIDSVRDTVRLHERNGWALPANLTPRNARAAAIDLAVAHVVMGEPDAARTLLLNLRGISPGELALLTHDPVLARVTSAQGVLEQIQVNALRREGLAFF